MKTEFAMIKESDWKKFKNLKELALERFCTETLAGCSKAIEHEGASSHSRYLSLYEIVQDADRRIASLFNYHSRSKAQMQLMMLRSEGLVYDDELEGLSNEFIQATEPLSKNT